MASSYLLTYREHYFFNPQKKEKFVPIYLRNKAYLLKEQLKKEKAQAALDEKRSTYPLLALMLLELEEKLMQYPLYVLKGIADDIAYRKYYIALL